MFKPTSSIMSGTSANSWVSGRAVQLNGATYEYCTASAATPAGILCGSWEGGEAADVLVGNFITCDVSGSVAEGAFLMSSADGDGKLATLSGSVPVVGRAVAASTAAGKCMVQVGILPA